MKKISADFRKGFAKIKVENLDDLWYLSQVIDKGDLISGRTFRRVKSSQQDENAKAEKKPVFIKIKAEKIEFSETQSSLRILGAIIEGPEDIPHGEHHTFSIEISTELTIEKEKWFGFQVDKLKEAFESKSASILIVAFDREEAYFALMKKYGYEILGQIKGDVAKKAVDEKKHSNFYAEIISHIKEYDTRYNFDNIIMGSPAFWKDELLKHLDDASLKKKMVMATCSSATKSAINEILKRDEVKKVLSSDRTTKEINMVEDMMSEISKQGKASYGIKDVETAINNGAVDLLLITDSLIQKLRSENNFARLEKIMKNADSINAKIHIISAQHEGGKKLDGLGGIGAILRYKLSY